MRMILGANPIVHLVYLSMLLGLAIYHNNKPVLCFNMTLKEWNQLIEKSDGLSRGLYRGYKDATVTHYYHNPSVEETIFNAKTDSMAAIKTFNLITNKNVVWRHRKFDLDTTRASFEKANRIIISVADSNKIHSPFYTWSAPESTDQEYLLSWVMLHRLKLSLNQLMAMESIAKPYQDWDCTPYQIEFAVETTAAYVNRPFQAKMLLVKQTGQPRNVLYLVNGDTLSAEQGGGVLQKTFKTPGLKTLNLEVQVINPLTKEIHKYRRNISLMVSPEIN